VKAKSLLDLQEYFHNELVCAQYLEQMRWDGKPLCPHCGSEHHYRTTTRFKNPALKDYKDFLCKACGKKYTVITGTIYECSKVSLRTWLLAEYLIANHKKGISSLQLARDLGVTQNTAWFILHRIRASFKEDHEEKLTGITQIDETFVGGKNKNRHYDKKVKYVGREPSRVDKTPVMGLLNYGKVRLFAVKDTSYDELRGVINRNIELRSIIISDDLYSYRTLGESYMHFIVRHSAKRYRSKEGFSTNGIENVWSILKRGIIGIYHYVSRKHLQRYCDEFAYRFNTLSLTVVERFEDAIRRCGNARLTYKVLIS